MPEWHLYTSLQTISITKHYQLLNRLPAIDAQYAVSIDRLFQKRMCLKDRISTEPIID